MKKRFLISILLAATIALSACSAPSNSAAPDWDAPASSAEMPSTDAPADSGSTEIEYWDGDEETDDEPGGEAASPRPATDQEESGGTESYLVIDENKEKLVGDESVLTFSLKVDTAAYTNVARFLEGGSLPPRDAVRTEELINYFNYDAEMKFDGDSPFAIYTEVGPSPFDANKHLAFIRVKTEELDKDQLPPLNLTFLIDTSGSMSSYDKLPLLKQSLGLLVETLGEDDVVSIVTYAGSSGVQLDSVSGADQKKIMKAINKLNASGSTAGGQGIVTAYALAEKNFRQDANNRVILCSDGDFNVGISNVDDLKRLISQKRDSGVYLSVLGFGTGNIRDDIMETLAANGNGNYSYINNISTGQKVLVEEMSSNLFTVADDVKAQVEFNPANVKSYRLIGYENRRLQNRDFEDDTKDAGEIGIGTDVVMMFELELRGEGADRSLKYQEAAEEEEEPLTYADELFEVRIRYKDPGESTSKLIERPVTYGSVTGDGSSDFWFASSVAAFGHLLRDSEYVGDATVSHIYELAQANLGRDEGGYRAEYLELLELFAELYA